MDYSDYKLVRDTAWKCLIDCGIRTAREIASVCDISITAAKIREARMAVLYERNKFLTSPLEQKVYKNFETFVEKYKQHKC